MGNSNVSTATDIFKVGIAGDKIFFYISNRSHYATFIVHINALAINTLIQSCSVQEQNIPPSTNVRRITSPSNEQTYFSIDLLNENTLQQIFTRVLQLLYKEIALAFTKISISEFKSAHGSTNILWQTIYSNIQNVAGNYLHANSPEYYNMLHSCQEYLDTKTSSILASFNFTQLLAQCTSQYKYDMFAKYEISDSQKVYIGDTAKTKQLVTKIVDKLDIVNQLIQHLVSGSDMLFKEQQTNNSNKSVYGYLMLGGIATLFFNLGRHRKSEEPPSSNNSQLKGGNDFGGDILTTQCFY